MIFLVFQAEMHFRSQEPFTAAPVMSSQIPTRGAAMDKDRIEGAAKQAKGAVKETAGKLSGDVKLETEGQADKVEGKVQNTVGGLKDSLRDN
jgi:uncharacterized protein YjbJ (UPF0337 family)